MGAARPRHSVLRRAAAVPAAPIATLDQDVALLRSYLELMQMRMPDRLDFKITIDPALRGLRLPPMTLLTLVENAVHHGIDPSEAGGRIEVGAQRNVDGGPSRCGCRTPVAASTNRSPPAPGWPTCASDCWQPMAAHLARLWPVGYRRRAQHGRARADRLRHCLRAVRGQGFRAGRDRRPGQTLRRGAPGRDGAALEAALAAAARGRSARRHGARRARAPGRRAARPW